MGTIFDFRSGTVIVRGLFALSLGALGVVFGTLGVAANAANRTDKVAGLISDKAAASDDNSPNNGTADWVSPPGLTPAARADAAMTYDAARQQVVLFGGIVGGGGLAGLNNETWLLQSGNWRQAGPQHFPLGRQNAGVAYDAARQQVVLFGGYTSSATQFADSNDTWIWDGADWTQAATSPLPENNPSVREAPAMAYFPDSNEVILFGGLSSSNGQNSTLNDTWAWNGSAWTQLSPAASPPARYAATLAYDAAHHKLVLFGGAGRNDTWTWDGTNWTQQNPAAAPSVRSYAVATYDSDRGVVLLYGGLDQSGQPLDDTWTWDGTAWTQQQPAHTPGARGDAVLAYDASQHRAFLYGGADAATAFGDTWTWDGTDWVSLGEATQPRPRVAATMAYDPRHANSVLFGGAGGGTAGLSNETWTWDGGGWTQHQPAVVPPARGYTALVDDPAVGRIVMFGGFGSGGLLNDTWTWDGITWRLESTAQSPPARTGAQLAFDGTHLLLYGGYNGNDIIYGDTWSWDGMNWTQLTPATSPPARANGAMTYDPVHQQVVLFGGSKDIGACPPVCSGRGIETAETWTWDGTTWTQRQPAHSPPATSQHSIVFDPDLGGVVLFNGGSAGAQGYDLIGTKGFFNNQLWLWDGTDWTQLSTSTVPGPRGAAAFTYDAARHALVLHSGNGVHGIQGDTWTLLPPSVELVNVASRKVHGSAGTFDIVLPLTATPGIECRSGGSNGDHTIIFTFANPLSAVGGASVTSGTGSVSSSSIDSNDGHKYIVNLTGVTNAQTITVSLTNVNDSAHNYSSTVRGQIGILVGDVNASAVVTSGDTNLCKAEALQQLTTANFRNDVNSSGSITTGDVNLIKQNALSQLPASP